MMRKIGLYVVLAALVVFVVTFVFVIVAQIRNRPASLDEGVSRLPQLSSDVTGEEWNTFSGKYVVFQYPRDWTLKRSLPGVQNIVYDQVRFNIFGVSSFTIGDSNVPYGVAVSNLDREQTIVAKENVTVGGRQGVKFLREDEKSFYFDVISPGSEKVGSFAIRIAVGKGYLEKDQLFATADKIAQSVRFLR